eukprot:TRINITY_DN5133_c0_g2_i5.p1 TRINITY_DN5133_c0_g2~~TRINITY_DN5133_c0_g2_i5.p1  ORF type:complete len:403 (+),score=161.03 TRINITY_DN5133_c0_g2_i5:54-1262(+)
MYAKVMLVLGCIALHAGVVDAGCDGECGSACAAPRCECSKVLWWCQQKCLGDYYGDDCMCNWQGTSTSATNLLFPDSMKGILTAVRSNDDTEVVLGGWSGLWVSTDSSAESYRQITGFSDQNVWTAAKDGDLIVAGGPTGIYRSTDNGKSVSLVSQGLSQYGDNNFAAQGNILILGDAVYAGTFEGLYVSKQRGATGTWEKICDAIIVEATSRSGCNSTARDLLRSPDGNYVVVTYEGSTTIFAVEIATNAVTTLTTEASWCDKAHPAAICSTWHLALFGDFLVLSPRPGAALKAIKLSAQSMGWITLDVSAEEQGDVQYIGEVNGKLYVQYSTRIWSYTTLGSAPQLVADMAEPACQGVLDELRFNVPRLPMIGGFAVSPNGEYLVVGAGSGAYRVINHSV